MDSYQSAASLCRLYPWGSSASAGAVVTVQNKAPPADVGGAVGLTRFFQSFGGAIGISLLTIYQASRCHVLSAGATSESQLLSALARSNAEVFVILAALIGSAFVCSLWLTGRIVPSRSKRSDSAPSEESIDSPAL